MPFLPDERSTDKLLKNLGIDLSQRFGGRDLKSFGWFQYRDYDHPKTAVSTEFAASAFLYLSFDEQGSWRRNPGVIAAIIAFMGRYHAQTPQVQDLGRLKQLIDAKPPDARAISEWFHAIYPPDRIPE